MKFASLLCFALLLPQAWSTVSGQTVHGTVTDRTTGEPVGYANIWFNGTGRGTVADGHGIYSIDAGTVTPDHTLSFNCIGYDTFTVRLRDIPQDGTFDAFLAPVPQVIEEVTVVPVKTRLKRLGNNFRSPLMEAVHQDDLTGVEFGTIIKIKKRTWLEKVRINVLSCSYDDLVFRLNIYGRDEMGRFVNILRQPIYASIPRTDDPTTVTINLADLHIVTDDDLIVAYQHISSSLTGQIRFPIGLTGARSCVRYNQGDAWEDTEWSFRFPISLIARVER